MDIGARTETAGAAPHRQRGLTILAFMLVAAVVVIFAMVGFRVVPSYIEYFSVKRALGSSPLDLPGRSDRSRPARARPQGQPG